MANAMIMSGAGLVLLCFTFGGFFSKIWPITIAGGIGWAGFAVWLFTNGSEYSLYWFLGFVAILMFIISVAIPIWMRQRPSTEVDEDDGRNSINEAVEGWYQKDVLSEPFSRKRRRRFSEKDDELD